MPKKGEHIHKRKDGRWEGRYRNGTNIHGKAIYRSVYGKTYLEVKKKLSVCSETKVVVQSQIKKTMLFRDAVFLWQKAKASQHKGATDVKYDNLINKHILPVLGDYKLSEINTFLIADFMNNKLNFGRIDCKGGLSPSYVRSMMLIVLDIIDFAVEEEMCAPIKVKIRKPVVEKREFEILDTSSQIYFENRLLQNPNETTVGVLISLNTGLRISEVCALKWSDIDFQNAILHVRSTVTRVKSSENDTTATKLIIDRPKTKSSLRDIPISQKLMVSLVTLYEKRKSDYVISDKSGFISPRTYEYRFHKVLEEYNIPSINYHALRHTFATRCIELGVDVKTLSEILGHANVSITLNTYVHSSMERKREQLEKLSSIETYVKGQNMVKNMPKTLF